jgi:citrate lyase subunit beta/citryl-CoA lyase
MPAHPSEVLYSGEVRPALLPVCDHYAGNAKFVYKALDLQRKLGAVFDITCDLEDGARDQGLDASLLLAGEFAGVIASAHNLHGRMGVRVHPLDDERCEHETELLMSRCGAQLAYLMLPKAHGLADVQRFCAFVRSTARALGLPHAPAVQVLIETHGALRGVFDIAALPEVESLSFGLMDFVSAHHGAISADAMKSPGQFEHPLVRRAKLEISAACHAHGKVPSHNVCTDIRDPQQAARDAHRAKNEFGFTRMWSIHPDQIEPIVHALSPSIADLKHAERVIEAAIKDDWAPVNVDGQLHDRASYRYYWQQLSHAYSTGYTSNSILIREVLADSPDFQPL